MPKKHLSLIIAIILLAVNMRAPIVSFGSVAKLIQADLQLSSAMIGLLGAIPMAAFAIGSILAPQISARFGLERSIVALAGILTIMIAGRVLGQATLFFIGTIGLSLMIALGNVLVPAIIKKYAKENLSAVTGIYSMSLSFFAGLSAGVVIPMANWSSHYFKHVEGWRMALGVWSLMALMATMMWFWLSQKWQANHPQQKQAPSTKHQSTPSVWRSSLAWWISGLMGLQSLLYYTLASFLGLLLVSRGISETTSGMVMLLLQCVAIPSGLFLAYWVGAGHSMRMIAILASLFNLIGVAGFAFLPTFWVWLMAILVGVGCALLFTLCLMLFGLKSQNDQQTVNLAGMVQAVGYGLAFFGPIMVGSLLSWSGSFDLPIKVLLIILMIKLLCAWFATSNRGL